MNSFLLLSALIYVTFGPCILADTCYDQNPSNCAFFLQKFPDSCTSTTSFISGQPFSTYCAKTCNTNCTSSNTNCSNTYDTICNLFGRKYCTNNSYIYGQLFKNICPKLCNGCPPPRVCYNQDDIICNLYGTSYCTTYSYINSQLFIDYCQKVCNTC